MRYHGLLLAPLLGGTILSSPLLAQAVNDAVPPERQNLDDNYVDRVSGMPFVPQPVLAIGQEGRGGLAVRGTAAYAGNRTDNGGSAGGAGTNWGLAIYADGANINVGLGQTTERFVKDGSTFTSADGSGSQLTQSGATYTYTARDGTIINYNSALKSSLETAQVARATKITYPTGEQVTLAWSAGSYCMADADGCRAGSYLTRVRLQSVESSNGYQLQYTYARGKVAARIFNNDDTNRDYNRLTEISAINLALDYCDPYANSCATNNQDPQSLSYANTVDGGNYTTQITDPDGRVWKYARSSTALTVQRPGSSSPDVTYTLNGGLVSNVIHDGITDAYAQSDEGGLRIIRVTTDPGGLNLVETTTADPARFVLLSTATQVGPNDTVTVTNSYDGQSRLTETLFPEGNRVLYTYDGRGNVLTTTQKPKPGSGQNDIVTSATYAPTCASVVTCNKPLSTTDALGRVTNYSYDPSHGGVLTVTLPAPIANGVRPVVTSTYTQFQARYLDASGAIASSGAPTWRLTQTSKCQTKASCAGSSDEVRETLNYGPPSGSTPNNLLLAYRTVGSGSNPNMSVVGYTYTAVGDVSIVDGPRADADDRTYLRYSKDREVTMVIGPDPDGAGELKNRAQRMTYNLRGQVTAVEAGTATTDGSSFTRLAYRTYGYDAAGHKAVEASWTGGGEADSVTQYVYDAAGRLSCTAQRMNRAVYGSLTMGCALSAQGSFGPDRLTTVSYDGADRPTEVVSGYGTPQQRTETSYDYTANGKVSLVKDARGNQTSYTYDGFDRLKTTTYPDGSAESLSYNAVSNVIVRTQRDGKSIGYRYDALDRLTNVDLPSDVTTNANRGFSYDLVGNLLSAVTGGGGYGTETFFTSDALGRKLTERSRFNGSGEKTKSYTYGAAGQRTRLTLPDTGLFFTYDYDAANQLKAIRENGSGIVASFAYDDLGRRKSRAYPNGTSTGYGYDGVSRLETLTLNGGGQPLTIGLDGYNPAGQIGSRSSSNDTYAWGDGVTANRSYVVNTLNQYSSVAGGAIGYDRRGNLTSATGWTYGYDSFNQLTSYTPPGGAAQRFVYDALGRLVYTTATASRFDFDGDDLIGEYDGAGNLANRYLFGPGADEPLVQYPGTDLAAKRYLDADERGSIVRLTDGGGGLLKQQSYDEFGVPDRDNSLRFGYTGQAWIASAGLAWYKARMYSPTLGRFMQTDPVGYADGMNWYNYVGGDPISNSDPSGLGRRRPIPPKSEGGGGGGGGGSGPPTGCLTQCGGGSASNFGYIGGVGGRGGASAGGSGGPQKITTTTTIALNGVTLTSFETTSFDFSPPSGSFGIGLPQSGSGPVGGDVIYVTGRSIPRGTYRDLTALDLGPTSNVVSLSGQIGIIGENLNIYVAYIEGRGNVMRQGIGRAVSTARSLGLSNVNFTGLIANGGLLNYLVPDSTLFRSYPGTSVRFYGPNSQIVTITIPVSR